MIGYLRTRVRKQPIIALYFEFCIKHAFRSHFKGLVNVYLEFQSTIILKDKSIYMYFYKWNKIKINTAFLT